MVTRKEWSDDDIRLHEGAMGAAGAAHGVAGGSVDRICGAEEGATRSLMQSTRTDPPGAARTAGHGGDGGGFRFMALRQLVWNNDYNIKPGDLRRSSAGSSHASIATTRRCAT